ncbi:hypothetical protein A0130_12710 [Leifsonia xyli]|uniref:cell wall-binding repeat-containing protein n=1 Tax=Leifsonia xyli TaxID=1575 RepID=UPI0007CDEC70|nr:hypothetical protein A0130_12710 [Leifsonia xyli]
MKFRTAAAASVVVALAAAILPVTPASANLSSIAPIGSMESISVRYTGTDPRPTLHIKGWAADANDGYANGSNGAGVEFTVAVGSGPRSSIGYAEFGGFVGYRPDIAWAHPGIGPNQGFDYLSGALPVTGAVSVCARLYNIDAAPVYTAILGCVTVNVPAARPAWTASITGSSEAGSVLTASLAQPSGGTETYAWNSLANVINTPATVIAGATAPTYTTDLSQAGRGIFAIVTTRVPGYTIEQATDPVQVSFTLPGGWTRVAAADRFATSVAASQAAFPDSAAGVPVAYIASGVAFPDALSAGAAAAKQHGTLLLTQPGALDPNVAAELVRLHPTRIIVVGGVQALSDAVVAALQGLPFAPQVKRIGGSDRFEVSRAIVDDAFGGSVPDLYLVTGNAFPDALAAAAAGAQTGRPVLLVNGWLPKPDAATASALSRWGTTHATVVGGTDTVSSGLAANLGVAVDRVAGSDRFATAAALARTLPPTGIAYMASGMNFPDALSTAVLAASKPGPLLLATGWCAPVSALSAMRDTAVNRLVAVGGDDVLNPSSWYYAC